MKHFVQYAFALCALTMVWQMSAAQETIVTDGVRISDITMQRSAGRLDVAMDVDLTDLKIKSNRSLWITPMVTDGNRYVELPAIVVDGRRRSIVRERQMRREPVSDDIYVRRHNHHMQNVDYETDIPYERWMDNSKLVLQQEWCACRDRSLGAELITAATMAPAMQPGTSSQSAKPSQQMPAGKPQMAYATPSDNGKMRTAQGTAAVYFPVNKSEIDPSYMDNKAEMEKIRSTVSGVAGNADNKITSVHLMGYASPEGPYANNVKLAANRAAAVKNYLVNNKLVDASLITVDSSPANWDALKQMLTESCINDYRRIIGVIDDPSIKPENKNAEIRCRFPVEYDFMLRTWYPKLRVTDYTVNYNVRPYTVDEAKKLVYTNPVQLSPAEIYMVALTFEKGSKEWNDIILIAVQTYPQFPESRVNAANVAMANGNYTQAAAYLEGVPSTMPEAMNSRGILAMSQGDYQQAMSLFQQAQKAGVKEAAYNISLLKQLMQADN